MEARLLYLCLQHLDHNCRKSIRKRPGYQDKGGREDRYNTERTTAKVRSVQTEKMRERKLHGLQQDGKGPCSTHGITYEIECQECKDKYVDETARNAYTRGTEYAEGIESKSEKSAL